MEFLNFDNIGGVPLWVLAVVIIFFIGWIEFDRCRGK